MPLSIFAQANTTDGNCNLNIYSLANNSTFTKYVLLGQPFWNYFEVDVTVNYAANYGPY